MNITSLCPGDKIISNKEVTRFVLFTSYVINVRLLLSVAYWQHLRFQIVVIICNISCTLLFLSCFQLELRKFPKCGIHKGILILLLCFFFC